MAIEFKYTPEEFAARVKAYHFKIETQQGEFPDLAGLKNALELEDGEYEAMNEDPMYHSICLWAMRRRESYLNRAALRVKNTTGIKMLLAQPENGGYVEKPVDKTPRQIEVTLRGMLDGNDNTFDCAGSDDSSDDVEDVGDVGDDSKAESDNGTPDRTPNRAVKKPRTSTKQDG